MTDLQKYSRLGIVWLSVLGLIAVWQSPAQAYTILGQDIYYHGGALKFEILPYEAAYTNHIYLYTAKEAIFLGSSSSTGMVINISDPSAVGLNPEDEFVLGIHVINTGNDFVMGGGYDNPDGIVHAAVDYTSDYTAVIGFEDLLHGGDLDYDDAVIRVTGNIGIAQIPEPASLVLLGSGVIGLMFIFHRHKGRLRRGQPDRGEPAWNHSRSWDYGPSGGLGVVLVILLLLMFSGRI